MKELLKAPDHLRAVNKYLKQHGLWQCPEWEYAAPANGIEERNPCCRVK